MKKNRKLVLAKETLRALTPAQASEVPGGVAFTSTFDPQCYYTEAHCDTRP